MSIMSYNTYFFFFSSRRRHTRSLRDWSSDVCSSDLHKIPAVKFRRSANGSAKFYCRDLMMKKLILKNWQAKIISLLLAGTLWYLIKKNVATTPSPSEETSTATEQTR